MYIFCVEEIHSYLLLLWSFVWNTFIFLNWRFLSLNYVSRWFSLFAHSTHRVYVCVWMWMLFFTSKGILKNWLIHMNCINGTKYNCTHSHTHKKQMKLFGWIVIHKVFFLWVTYSFFRRIFIFYKHSFSIMFIGLYNFNCRPNCSNLILFILNSI